MIYVDKAQLIQSVCNGDLGAWTDTLRSLVTVADMLEAAEEEAC